jgi:hypothetical protein
MSRYQFISEEEFKVMEARVRRVCGPTLEVPQPHGELKKPRKAMMPVSKVHGSGVGSNPASLYKSKLEAAYASKLDLEQKAGLIKSWHYEPISLKLAKGKRYRPDFLIQYPDGLEQRLEFVEVKGRMFKNRRDGMTHLAWAAQLYPMFVWRIVRWTGHGFDAEYI